MTIWEPAHECMHRENIEQLQLERLQATINRVYKNVSCYRKKFQELAIIPEDIRSLSDLSRLPFTSRNDLQLNYPYGMFAVPLREVVRLHTSSGSTSKPLVVGYTRHDVRTWANLVARLLVSAGVTHDDVVQIAFKYGLFTGAFGIHYGAEAIGASVIPTGTGNTDKQIMIMQDYKTTALVCTPAYALVLADRIDQLGIQPKGLSLHVGVFGGEPWSEAMRAEIEQRLSITAMDNYGMSEVIGPGIAGECECRRGMHIFEDAFIPEIIDPKTGAPVAPGNMGELVLTTLIKEAFPLIRYRTGDLTSLDYAKCDCGRTLVRMSRTSARCDDMLIIKGVNVFPSQVREIIYAAAQGEPPYQIVLDRKGGVETLEIRIEVTEKIFSLEMQRQRAFLEMVRRRVDSVLGISAIVKLVEPKSLPRKDGKVDLVLDLRK
jgi:phenylacetate-CoA ligase